MKKVVLKVDLYDNKVKQKAMKAVSGLSGVESIAVDMKDKKFTVIGDADPVIIMSKLRKICQVSILSVGPAREPKKKEEDGKKEEVKKQEPTKEEPKKKEEVKKQEPTNIDPVTIMGKLRKGAWEEFVDIVTGGLAKVRGKKKEDGKKEEVKKQEPTKDEPKKKDDPNKPMGETSLASFVILVLDKLTSDEVLNVASKLGIQSRLQKWTKILKNIGRVLADAVLKQYKDTDVEKWLNKLKDLAYDIDDTIDGLVTDQVGQRPHSQDSSSTSQVSFNLFSPSTDLINKIGEISRRLEEIVGEINDLSLKENNNLVGGIQFPSSISSSLKENNNVYGREEEKKAILETTLLVLKVDFYDNKVKQAALKVVSGLSEVESFVVDMKDKKFTVIGNTDPVTIVSKLRKLCHVDILSIGPAKEPETKKEDGKKEEVKKQEPTKEEPRKKEEVNKPMGETFLASFVILVLDKLTSDEVLNVASKLGIQSRLQKWTKILKNIGRVLADAELKQYKYTDVKKWLNKLEDLAYDMDDTIDGLVTDQVGHRPHSQDSSSTGQVSFNPFSPSTDLINKIGEISRRLEEIVGEIDDLSLKENNNIVGGIQFPSSISSSLKENNNVYGREEEKKAILEILFKDEATFGDECVVPIVGMGGVGKTTLAQLLYNDEEVNSFFDLKAWACVGFVSDKFVVGVTKKILESLTKKPCKLKELDPVHVSLQEKLSGKKFLVVLDDIWKIEWDEWDSLNLPFFAGARGSKVIVTTRSADVAKKMSRIEIRELKQLGDDHSLSLLARHALGRDSFEEHQDLKEIGEEILKKCQGLPLAITAVGGLLRTQEHQSQWEHILHSEVWDLSGRILPALLLSYHYLPSHLKRCFAACAIIPKNCEFSKKELILLWMAMGLLRQSREMNFLEDFGAKCFDDLLSRSFFQNSARSESQFVMHDLIIDAAESVAGEICCRWEDMLENTKISERARYSSFTDQAHDVFENFKDFNSVQRLRTLVSIGSCAHSSCLRGKVLVHLVPKFKFLRVLRLLHIEELPDYIGELKHLRHLDLSFTDVEVLPASICTLYNLLTLSVNCCFFLRNLPADIGNLINLRHLDNAHTAALKEMPCGISKLESLQTLSKFVVGKGSGLKLRELKNLMLRGSLSIHGLEDVMNSKDAEEASLKLKQDLDELELVWKSDDEHHRDEELEFDVLDKLKPHRNLKKLEINGYRCSKISSWVGDPSFCELTGISIINCRNCTSLPPLWELPMLKHLEIIGMFELRSIVQFYNDGDDRQFLLPPTLTRLVIEGLPNLESLSNGLQNLSSLKKLTIVNCPKLRSFPNGEVLSNLSELTVKNCPILEKRIEDEGYCRPILASIPECGIHRVESDESDESDD